MEFGDFMAEVEGVGVEFIRLCMRLSVRVQDNYVSCANLLNINFKIHK